MTWIRFGRNEPLAPNGPLLDREGKAFNLRAYAGGCALLIFFAPSSGAAGCEGLLEVLLAAARDESEAQALVVSGARVDLDGVLGDVPVVFDEGGEVAASYRRLLEVDTSGQPLLFVLDRDGAPVYAWFGACDAQDDLSSELRRRLQSAAFLCPECSMLDPAASEMWEVVY